MPPSLVPVIKWGEYTSLEVQYGSETHLIVGAPAGWSSLRAREGVISAAALLPVKAISFGELRVLRVLPAVLWLAAQTQADILGSDLLDELEAAFNGFLDLPSGYDIKDNEEFEYVVVGAGAAGCAVASRLALAGYSVILLEAGNVPSGLTWVPGASQALLGSTDDWQYGTIPNNVSCLSSDGKQCQASRGKTLGGSTAINYMMYVRGNRDDYNFGIPGWTWDDIEPYFLVYEGLRDLQEFPTSSLPYHNTTGTVGVGYCADPENDWHDRIVEGLKSLGFPFNKDVNGESQVGVTRVVTYTKGGVRMSTARAYLHRDDVKKVIKVSTATHVTGVLFGDGNVANGVTAVQGPLNKKITIRASKGVILSAGTLSTPQILMLSGIGPAEHLKEVGIEPRIDLPVGKNLTDHVLPLMFIKTNAKLLKKLTSLVSLGTSPVKYITSQKGYLASIGLTDISAFVNTLCYDYDTRKWNYNSSDCQYPTMQLINAYIPQGSVTIGSPIVKNSIQMNDDVIGQLAVENAGSALLEVSPVVLAPASRGWVKLYSNNPLDPPAIFPNYLSDPSDVEEMVRAITMVEHLVDTAAYGDASIVHLDLPDCPDYSSDRVGYWSCYVRHLTFSVFHSTSTCAVGDVLDERMGVLGTSALHVADLSALPKIPRGNTAAAAIALGERLADFLIKDDTSN